MTNTYNKAYLYNLRRTTYFLKAKEETQYTEILSTSSAVIPPLVNYYSFIKFIAIMCNKTTCYVFNTHKL